MNYFKRLDVSGLATTYATAATVLFGDTTPCETNNQDVINETAAEVIMVSFDGKTDHGRLDVTGATIGHSWVDHKRDRMWLRRTSTGGGAQFVQIYAWK